MPILPDLLRPGLDIVFCGMAPSAESARQRAYYAHPGNRFWRTLHETGLTTRRLAPEEYRALPELGIGFTDVCKRESGRDSELSKAALDPAAVRRKIAKFQPRFLACTSKTAGQSAFSIAQICNCHRGSPLKVPLVVPAYHCTLSIVGSLIRATASAQN